MELVKKSIHDYKVKNKTTVQVTLNDDFNVPDIKPDIEQIVKERGNVHIESVRVNGDKVDVMGNLEFAILYMSDLPINMSGHMDFQEKVNIDGIDGDETVSCIAEIEDLTIKAINSRKVSIKAIISLNVLCEKLDDEQLVTEIEFDDKCECLQTRNKNINISEIAVNMKDNFRIREKLELVQGKPNIAELLWFDTCIKSFDIRPVEGAVALVGEIGIFILYISADENQSVQWYESSMPFDGSIDVSGCTSDMIAYVGYQIQSCDIEIKPDYDGEDRVVEMEMVLDLNIKCYEEKQLAIIDDIYCPTKNILLENKTAKLHRLLVKNNSKCRVNNRIKVNEAVKILQICNCTGVVKVDDVTVTDNSIAVDGIIVLNVFYITEDDNMPMRCVKGSVPFSHNIDVKNESVPEQIQYNINVNLEMLSAVMLGVDEIEIKAVVALDTICFNVISENAIESVRIEEYEDSQYNQIPSIIGYIANSEDTLWDIAKKYHTTVDTIKNANKLSHDKIGKGDKIILVKSERG